MNQGNGGLLALCGLLGVIAFGVLFVVPRMMDGREDGPVVEETARAPDTAAPAGEAEPAPTGDETAAGRQGRPVGEAGEAAGDTDASGIREDGAAVATRTGGRPDAAPGEPLEPAFDLLRVEPDGSTVIAGRAEPGGRVEVMNGDEVLAEADVGPSGDFAAVFDEPLQPGDYQLSLRVTGEGDREIVSDEIATISIPRDGGSELLAMVTRPGEPSRIVSAPEGADAGPASPADRESGDAASAGAAAPADDATPPADAAATEEGAAGSGPNDLAAIDDEAPAAGAAEDAGTEDRDRPAATTAADTADETEMEAAASAAAPDAPGSPADAAAGEAGEAAPADETEIAAAPTGEDEPTTETSEAPPPALVRIDAVEVEGDRLFVAGSSASGSQVRVYADDAVVGDDRANSEGRFLVEGRMPLSVGQHTIRADLIDGNGTVVARALVPFERPAGGIAAAVASAETPPLGSGQGAEPGEDGASAETAGTGNGAGPDAAPAAAPETPAASGSEPEAAPDTASEPETEIATLADPAASPATGAESAGGSPPAGAPAATVPADEAGESAPPVDEELGEEEAAAAAPSAQTPAGASSEPAVAEADVPEADAAGADIEDRPAAVGDGGPGEGASPEAGPSEATPTETAAAEPAPAPVTIRQEPLTPSPSSVIIRRGDTLWQISRRVYGQGVRYTTIYLANQQQIADPDRIMPGQIFSVPDEAIDNAEEVHRRLRSGGDR